MMNRVSKELGEIRVWGDHAWGCRSCFPGSSCVGYCLGSSIICSSIGACRASSTGPIDRIGIDPKLDRIGSNP